MMHATLIHSEVADVIDEHASMKTVKGRQLPWMGSRLISLFKERD